MYLCSFSYFTPLFFSSFYFKKGSNVASIWARKEPQLLSRSKSGCSQSMMERISFSASFGCNGRSGVNTTAVPSNASFKTLAIGQLPVAKNPCRKSIFFILINYSLYLYVANWMDAGLVFVSFLFPYFPMTAIAATYIHNMRHFCDTTFNSFRCYAYL